MHDQNSQKSFGKLDVEVKNDELKKLLKRAVQNHLLLKMIIKQNN